MHEVMEAHEAPGSHEDSRLTLPVAVTLSILAVLVAIATLLGHRASTEEIILQTKASDQWALFQAKNIRLHEMQGFADLLGTLSPADKEKTEALRESTSKRPTDMSRRRTRRANRPRNSKRKGNQRAGGPTATRRVK